MKFIVDSMLGSLVKVLRILGFDTAYVRATAPLDLVVRARNQHRILVTRNRRLKNHPGVFFAAHETVEGQVSALFERFPLADAARPFSRCLACNGALAPAKPEEVEHGIPFHIRNTQTQFARCPDCGRVYWPGSHRRAMARLVRSLLDVPRGTPDRNRQTTGSGIKSGSST